MSYLPPVVARLSFDLGDFDAKIDEAKAKIKSLGDTVHIKTDIDNGALRKIAQDTEAMHRIMGKQVTEGIKVEGFEDASLKLDDIKAKMDSLNGKTARVKVKVDKSDLDQAESALDKLKSMFGGGHSFNLPFVNFTANPVGLAAIVSGVAALVPELVGVVSGFAAAGAGAGAFAALAYPAVKKVSTAYTDLKTAQAAYSAAKEKEALDPSKTNEAALKSAADNLKVVQEQIGKMPAAEQAAVTGISNLSTAYGKMSRAFEPKAFEVFSSGLKLTATLLPTITPFANTFADSMSRVLDNLNKSAHGKGFQDFLKQFHGIEGPAIQAIAAGIGNVAGSVGRLLTVMNGKDVAHAINIAFSALSGTIGGVTTAVKFLMQAWDGLVIYMHNVESALDGVRHFFASGGHDIAQDFDQIRHAVATAAHDIANGFDNVRHDIAAKFDGVKNDVVAKFNGAASWLADKAHAFASAFDTVRHDIAAKFDGIKGDITAKFSGAGGWLLSVGKDIVQGLINGLDSMIPGLGGVVSKIVGLLKSVGHAVGVKSPSTLFDYYGRMIGLGLAQGIESQYARVQQSATGLVGMTTGPVAGHGSAAMAANQPIHVHVELDGREIYSAVAKRSVQAQRRTGHNGMQKRTR